MTQRVKYNGYLFRVLAETEEEVQVDARMDFYDGRSRDVALWLEKGNVEFLTEKEQKMSESKVDGLLLSAADDGVLGQASLQALNLPSIKTEITLGIGGDIDDVEASEVILVTMLIDDSGSIRFAGNADAVRMGHNSLLQVLRDAKQKDGILVHTRYLNGKLLYPYLDLSSAEEMTNKNYDPCGGTPLYDQTAIILGTVLAKAQDFENNGVPCRTITILLTDGADVHSKHQTESSVKSIVDDMLRAETHIVAAMGIEDGSTHSRSFDFRQVFKNMGILDEWILTPKSDPSEIRKAFELVSQSALRASQSMKAFSSTAAGGFLG